MDRDRIVSMLAGCEGYLSGQSISQALGTTRAAVWKEISVLREAGWPIVSSTRLGYRLEGEPPVLSAGYLSSLLPEGSLFAGKLLIREQVDSTNTQLKALAAHGAAEGTVLLAEEQTAGRGTHGRSFLAPRGEGLYLSLLLRPHAPLEQLLTLTGWVAVAARRAIETASGAPARIKWLNDIWLGRRKLCGILTELSLLGESGEPDYVVVGIGVNVSQSGKTFQAQGLGEIASSLAGQGFPVGRNHLAACLLTELEHMYRSFPSRQPDYLDDYRRHCITLGSRVSFEHGGMTLAGSALAVDHSFAIIIQGDDGQRYTVTSGSVALQDAQNP